MQRNPFNPFLLNDGSIGAKSHRLEVCRRLHILTLSEPEGHLKEPSRHGKMLREGFRADFDLSPLKPGRYLLALEARSTRNKQRTVARQIPFDIVE